MLDQSSIPEAGAERAAARLTEICHQTGVCSPEGALTTVDIERIARR